MKNEAISADLVPKSRECAINYFFDNLVSEARFAPYLSEADEDRSKAIDLYFWAERLAAASFELLAHFEVGFRNAIDQKLRDYFETEAGAVPWIFSRSPLLGEKITGPIGATRDDLPPRQRDIRDQITANLHFGFWTRMCGKAKTELWDACLKEAFPNAGTRADVGSAVEGIRNFRNRIAHHDSMLEIDLAFEVERVFEVAGTISVEFKDFLEHNDQSLEIYRTRPTEPRDTLLVPGSKEWDLYQKTSVYVCQSGRTFRPVKRMLFYADRTIQREFPAVKYRRDNIPWTTGEAARLRNTGDSNLRRIAKAIEELHTNGWSDGSQVGGRYQAFVLTSPDEKPPHGIHKTLDTALVNKERGKGNAWVNKHRYLYSDRLLTEGEKYFSLDPQLIP